MTLSEKLGELRGMMLAMQASQTAAATEISRHAEADRLMFEKIDARVRSLEDEKNQRRGVMFIVAIIGAAVSQLAYFLITKLWRV